MSKELDNDLQQILLMYGHVDNGNQDGGEVDQTEDLKERVLMYAEAHHQERLKRMQPTSTFTIDWGNATYSPINDVAGPPPKESGTGSSVCNRLGCNMDQGRKPLTREQLNKHFDEWAKAKGLIK